MEDRPKYISKTIPPYYDYGLTNIKKIHNMPKFPNLSSKEIYNEIRVKEKSRTENINHSKIWKDIWKNLNFKYIPIMDRNIVYKFIHEILPTNKRLFQMKIKDSPNCKFCSSEDSNIHKFYTCTKIQKTVQIVKTFSFNFY